jgi:hypothetical protein
VRFLRKTGKPQEAETFLRTSVEVWEATIQKTSEPEHRKLLVDATDDLRTRLGALDRAGEAEGIIDQGSVGSPPTEAEALPKRSNPQRK